MMNLGKRHLLAPLVSVLMLAPALASADDPEWLLAPYGWLSDVSLDQSSGPGGSISASDLLDITDTAGMIRMEAAWKHWGFTVDYVFLDAAQSRDFSLPGPLLPDVNVLASIDVGLLELGGFYRPSGADSGVDYLFGVRRTSVEKVLLLTPSDGETERFGSEPEFTDVFVGARYLHRFNDNWDMSLRGDLGFGDSEGTVNLLAQIGYRFNTTFALNLGYRHLTFEYRENVGAQFETTDIELSGPLLGLVFRF
jgi:hypothetical protein